MMKRNKGFPLLPIVLVILVWVLGAMVSRNLVPDGTETEKNEVASLIVSVVLSGYVLIVR